MDKLGSIVKIQLNHHNLSSEALAAEVLFKANQWLADEFKEPAGEIRAVRLRHGILLIATESAVAGQEVWNVSDKIIKFLQNKFNSRIVQKVRIKNITNAENNVDSLIRME
jgi:hypothetical protein